MKVQRWVELLKTSSTELQPLEQMSFLSNCALVQVSAAPSMVVFVFVFVSDPPSFPSDV